MSVADHVVENCAGQWIEITTLSDPVPREKCSVCRAVRNAPTEDAEPSTRDFSPGEEVRYVPYHAHGDEAHEDCEIGIVDSVGSMFVFVIFDGKRRPEACKPDQLRKIRR